MCNEMDSGVFRSFGDSYDLGSRVQVLCSEVLGVWVIAIVIHILGKYMTIDY